MKLSGIPDCPSFLAELDAQRLLIVGNGPSAATAAWGSKIDGYDRIIRINNYVTQGMESRVGSRTDIWVNGANQGLHRRNELPEHILVMIPPAVLIHKGAAIHPRIRKRLGTAHYTLLPLEIMTELERSSGIDRPTTGFFAIYFFYLLGLDITLHGFDFFVGSTAHYFDSALKRWLKERGLIRKAGKHDVSAEKTIVEELVARGQIKLLGPS